MTVMFEAFTVLACHQFVALDQLQAVCKDGRAEAGERINRAHRGNLPLWDWLEMRLPSFYPMLNSRMKSCFLWVGGCDHLSGGCDWQSCRGDTCCGVVSAVACSASAHRRAAIAERADANLHRYDARFAEHVKHASDADGSLVRRRTCSA